MPKLSLLWLLIQSTAFNSTCVFGHLGSGLDDEEDEIIQMPEKRHDLIDFEHITYGHQMKSVIPAPVQLGSWQYD